MNNVFLTPEQEQLLRSAKSMLWLNPRYGDLSAAPEMPEAHQIEDAAARLQRFAPLLVQLFPELESEAGLIESPLLEANALNQAYNPVGGRLLLKADHALAVAGSIKARGGIHEVLCFAETIAIEKGLITTWDDDYTLLGQHHARSIFQKYTVAVGSTGNLGLSIGIMGSALGFQTEVHMSTDAKEWKKARLRKRGVTVVEHETDYSEAVAAGRQAASASPYHYFVDDESSAYLFMGYAVAARRLQAQLVEAGVIIDAEHPLFVYLPAGVGGAPGGILFGLKHCFGDHVHAFFAEPVQAPCMLLGMAGEAGSEPTPVYNYGLRIETDADGLAVGTASQWVCDATRHLLSGVYTATDNQLYQQLDRLKLIEAIEVEPSAAIGCLGPEVLSSPVGKHYLETHGLIQHLHNSTHIAWLTGGSFVPESEYQTYLEKAIALRS